MYVVRFEVMTSSMPHYLKALLAGPKYTNQEYVNFKDVSITYCFST